MTPLEMFACAARAQSQPGSLGVVMTVHKGGLPPGFPRGELLNEMRRNGRVERTCSFDPVKVMAWLLRNRLVVVDAAQDDASMLTVREATPPDGQ